MLVPMARVEIIGPKGLFLDVVSMIHEQGRLHIEDLSKKIRQGELPLNRMEVVGTQQRERDDMDELLIRVRSILKALSQGKPGSVQVNHSEYDRLYEMEPADMAKEINSIIAEVEEHTASLASAHTDLESEMALLARYEPILQKIQPLASQIVTTGSYDSVALLFERRYKAAIEALKEELDKLTHKQYEIVSTDVDEDTTAAIVVFDRRFSDAVHKFLAMENINQIRLPDEFDGMPFDNAYEEVKRRRLSLPAELKSTTAQLKELSEQWASRLAAVRDVLLDRTAEIEAIPKFGRTEYAFVITGWMPVEDVSGLKEQIKSKWGPDIIVEQTAIDEKDFGDTPVALKNNPMVTPFQSILGAYGLPRYGTIDPTFFLFIFFPLFFGMIVGDIGYGAVLLGLIIWLRLKFRENDAVQIATSVLGPAATAVLAFGFVYGEIFGNVFHKELVSVYRAIGLPSFLPFVRTEGELITVFMYVAIATGVVHVTMGLILGVINAVRTKNRHHLFEKGGILTFVVALFITVAITVAAKNLGSWALGAQAAFAILALAGFVFAVRGGGIMGVIETVEALSGMISYIRIMAVGLAGAIFAEAVNEIVLDMAKNNPAMIVVGAIIGILLHGLNFVIASFSPMIHALRLNFLEFFRGFYETGNKTYSPFTKTGGEEGA